MFKRVLIGIDRVDASRAPLWETVGRLSLEDGAQLIIAHVVESHPGRFGLLHEGYSEVEQHLAEARAAIEAAGGKVDRSIEVGIGLKSPSDVLVEMARTEQCDLIVLGTHRHGAWSGALLGSVSQRVVGHSSCPVLLVPCGD